MGARLATYYRKQSTIDAGAAALIKEQPFAGTAVPLEPGEGPRSWETSPRGRARAAWRRTCFGPPLPALRGALRLPARALPKGRLTVRRVSCLSVVGQQEPHVEVPAPGTKAVQLRNGDRLFADVCRAFRSQQHSEGSPGAKGGKGGQRATRGGEGGSAAPAAGFGGRAGCQLPFPLGSLPPEEAEVVC